MNEPFLMELIGMKEKNWVTPVERELIALDMIAVVGAEIVVDCMGLERKEILDQLEAEENGMYGDVGVGSQMLMAFLVRMYHQRIHHRLSEALNQIDVGVVGNERSHHLEGMDPVRNHQRDHDGKMDHQQMSYVEGALVHRP